MDKFFRDLLLKVELGIKPLQGYDGFLKGLQLLCFAFGRITRQLTVLLGDGAA